jgi:hypothetical protein
MTVLKSVKKDGRGGRRPGAGRKPVAKKLHGKALEFCEALMADAAADPKLRLEAAKTLLRHSPPVEKDQPQTEGVWADLLR